ncbi:hypothetical protein ASG93_16370 [Paenibacillus sp. Soil787]|nr:hypothetical protein ASG93_16370 [Paenibacillus sp. Soil787]
MRLDKNIHKWANTWRLASARIKCPLLHIDIMPFVWDYEGMCVGLIYDSIEQVASDMMDKYGRIDVLINNAGFAVGGYMEDVPMEA